MTPSCRRKSLLPAGTEKHNKRSMWAVNKNQQIKCGITSIKLHIDILYTNMHTYTLYMLEKIISIFFPYTGAAWSEGVVLRVNYLFLIFKHF